jgi:hypothetical protein
MTHKTVRALATLAAVALLVAACGGGSSDDESGDDASDEPTEEPADDRSASDTIDGCSIFKQADAEALFRRAVALVGSDVAYPDCTFDTVSAPLQRVFVYGTASDDANLIKQVEVFGGGFVDESVTAEPTGGVGDAAYAGPGVLAFRVGDTGVVIVAGSSEQRPNLGALRALAATLIARLP